MAFISLESLARLLLACAPALAFTPPVACLRHSLPPASVSDEWQEAPPHRVSEKMMRMALLLDRRSVFLSGTAMLSSSLVGSLFSPLVAKAYDVDTAFALASLMDLRADVMNADSVLTQDLSLESKNAEQKPVSMQTRKSVVAMMQFIVKQDPEKRIRSVASTARFAGVLTSKQELLVADYGRYAQQQLAAIVESEGIEGRSLRNQDLTGRELKEMKPQEVAYMHRQLFQAKRAIELAFLSFPADARREAAKYLAEAYGDDKVEKLLPDGSPGLPGFQAARLREEAIQRAISALPAPAPYFFKQDIIQDRNDVLQEKLCSPGQARNDALQELQEQLCSPAQAP